MHSDTVWLNSQILNSVAVSCLRGSGISCRCVAENRPEPSCAASVTPRTTRRRENASRYAFLASLNQSRRVFPSQPRRIRCDCRNAPAFHTTSVRTGWRALRRCRVWSVGCDDLLAARGWTAPGPSRVQLPRMRRAEMGFKPTRMLIIMTDRAYSSNI